MKLVLLGAPGSGKGTQAQLLAENFGKHISTGDILRRAVEAQTPLGVKANEYMRKGELVPDEIMIGILKEELKNLSLEEGFILDGFPRTINQAEALDKMLQSLGMKLDGVIEIEIPLEEVLRRLSLRRSCKNCGAVFHLIYNPPQRDNICNYCNTELYHREDDQEAVILKRYQLYKSHSLALQKYYLAKGIFKTIDGTQPIDKLKKEIVSFYGNAKV